jgi:putative transposase
VTRLRRIADRDRIFFVTTNLSRSARPLIASERDIVLNQLQRQRAAAQYLLFGYVVMPDHIHLLLAPSGSGLIASMREFKSCAAQALVKTGVRESPVWQPKYFDFILRRVHDFWDKLAYIHDNPVQTGLADTAPAWRWSSAAFYEGNAPTPVPVDSIDLPADRNALLWPAPWR